MNHSDDDFVRDVFSDFEIAEIETVYTMANENNQDYQRRRVELLVSNYDIYKHPRSIWVVSSGCY